MTLKEGDFLWKASDGSIDSCALTVYMDWLKTERGLEFGDYAALQKWSVDDLEGFWTSLWDYFKINADGDYSSVVDTLEMPGARWFSGAQVNFAEHVLRAGRDRPNQTVFYFASEGSDIGEISWAELDRKVKIFAGALREMGIKKGDRIVSFMPNIPETMIAVLAVTAVGAVWSSAAPEFGVKAVIDRFNQIEPKLLIAADGYVFGGKTFERQAEVEAILAGVPSIKTVLWHDQIHKGELAELRGTDVKALLPMIEADRDITDFTFTRVDSDHPLWILFSSGTTGLPKAIVHSHVGILLDFLKTGAFHLNSGPDEVMFFYTTAGWMMWNALLQSPINGGASVLYDGNPAYPNPDLLWEIASKTKATLFGASPTYVEIMRKNGIIPQELHDMSHLEKVMLAGSPSTPETFQWFYDNVSSDIWMTSSSGGTEFCGGVVVSVPTIPVYAGEIQARALGADVRVFDDAGKELIDEVGEMVICKPIPSMPIKLWGDTDNARYQSSYFEDYPGVWRHGDFLKINKRGGCYIYGRSDSTLNRFGVRIGSSEIYRTLENIDEVVDSMVICVELEGGDFYMPLFVQMREGHRFGEDIKKKIVTTLRKERSPRHVPDEILDATAIPYTLSGKKMEVPVRKLFLGFEPEKCFSKDAMKNPTSIDYYVNLADQKLEHLKGESS